MPQCTVAKCIDWNNVIAQMSKEYYPGILPQEGSWLATKANVSNRGFIDLIEGRAKGTKRSHRKRGWQAWGQTERTRTLRIKQPGAALSKPFLVGNPAQTLAARWPSL